MLPGMTAKRHGKGAAEGGKKVGGQFAPAAVADSPPPPPDGGLTLGSGGLSPVVREALFGQESETREKILGMRVCGHPHHTDEESAAAGILRGRCREHPDAAPVGLDDLSAGIEDARGQIPDGHTGRRDDDRFCVEALLHLVAAGRAASLDKSRGHVLSAADSMDRTAFAPAGHGFRLRALAEAMRLDDT